MAVTRAESLEVLRKRTSVKWTLFPPDVLPMFVAEMDYPLAPAVREALLDAVSRNDTGYADPLSSTVREAFAGFAEDTWGWRPDTRRMLTTTDVSVVIVESLRALVAPGEGVVITPPVYPPFFDLLPEAGAAVVEVPLLDDGRRHGLDLAGLDAALRSGAAKGVLLCNPHNPLGLVHSREELTELSRVVARHGGFVLSDEIHAPLAHHGVAFTPYLSVSDEARTHGLAAESASKAFNLAGLKCALLVAASRDMASVVSGLPYEVAARTGQLGLVATVAGFTRGREWLGETIAAVEENVALLERELSARLPSVVFRRPQASYLCWLDLRELGWGDDPAAVALEHGRLALVAGPDFGAQGRGFARINVACAPETVVEGVARLVRARAAVSG